MNRGFLITKRQKNSYYNMKVISPSNTNHTFSFVPRFNPKANLTLIIKKEGFETEDILNNSYIFTNGYVDITFYLTVVEGEKYKFEVKEGELTIYKGKLFVTNQDTQHYKQIQDIYIYE